MKKKKRMRHTVSSIRSSTFLDDLISQHNVANTFSFTEVSNSRPCTINIIKCIMYSVCCIYAEIDEQVIFIICYLIIRVYQCVGKNIEEHAM